MTHSRRIELTVEVATVVVVGLAAAGVKDLRRPTYVQHFDPRAFPPLPGKEELRSQTLLGCLIS